MNGWLIFLVFLVACGVVGLAVRMAVVAKRAAEQEKWAAGSIPGEVVVSSAEEHDEHREVLISMSVRSLGIPRESLQPGAHFRDDLRIPPGELDRLLDELQEHFGITIDRTRIERFGDLLDIIQREARWSSY